MTRASEQDLARLAGPARLAFMTPVREYPTLADRKASALLAADALILSVVVFFTDRIQHTAGSSGVMGAIVTLLVAGLVAALLGGALIAYRGLTFPMPPMPPSLAHFREIASRDRQAYAQAMRDLSHTQAIRDILHYNYSLATQSAAKFGLVRKSVRCFQVTLTLWLALLLLLATRG